MTRNVTAEEVKAAIGVREESIQPGERIVVDGLRFVIQMGLKLGDRQLFFATCLDKTSENPAYRDAHIRHIDTGCAMFERETLAILLETGNYVVA